MKDETKSSLVQSLKKAIEENDMETLNSLADKASNTSNPYQRIPVYEGKIPEGMELPKIRTAFAVHCRKAILEGDAQLVGDLIAGLRDITMENVTNASIFHGMFQAKQIAQLKKGKSSEEFWRAVGERILSSDMIQKFPAWACRVLYLYAEKEQYEALKDVKFWELGKQLRNSIENQDEQSLAKLLLMLDTNTEGGLHECCWEGAVCFFDLDEGYEADIITILRDLGAVNAGTCDIEDVWDQITPQKQCEAFARFILTHKEFWRNIVSHLLNHCRDHGGYDIIADIMT